MAGNPHRGKAGSFLDIIPSICPWHSKLRRDIQLCFDAKALWIRSQHSCQAQRSLKCYGRNAQREG